MCKSRWAALALIASVIAAPPLAAQPRTTAQNAYQAMAYQNALRLQQQQNALRLQQQQNALRLQQQQNALRLKQQTQPNSAIVAYQNDLRQQQIQAAKLQADALAIKKVQQKEITDSPKAYSPARLAQIHRDWQINPLALERQALTGEVAVLTQEKAVVARQGAQLPPGLDAQLRAMQQRLAAINVSLNKLEPGGGLGSGGGGGVCAADGSAAGGAAASGDGGGGCGDGGGSGD